MSQDNIYRCLKLKFVSVPSGATLKKRSSRSPSRSIALVLMIVIIVSASIGGYYLYARTLRSKNSTPVLSETLRSPDPAKDEYFGISVATSGDLALVDDARVPYGVNNTYVDNLTGGLANAYLFNASTGSYIRTLSSPPVLINGIHYSTVALNRNTAVVGCVYYPQNGTTIGRVYVFNASTGDLLYTLKSPNSQSGGAFGYHMALGGDLLAVLAANSVDMYNASTGNLIREIAIPVQQGSSDRSVAISGDLLAVGAVNDSGSIHVGTVYLFNASSGSLFRTFSDPAPSSSDQFGSVVAISGNKVAISAVGQEIDGRVGKYGEVFVFDAPTGKLLLNFTSPDLNSSRMFGVSLAIDGNRLVVGESGSVQGNLGAGRVYLFDVKTGSLLGNLTSPNPEGNGDLGSSVSIDQNYVLVGAVSERVNSLLVVGNAYVYRV